MRLMIVVGIVGAKYIWRRINAPIEGMALMVYASRRFIYIFRYLRCLFGFTLDYLLTLGDLFALLG